MSDDKVTPLPERPEIPTLALWMLLKRCPLPQTDDGRPEPGSEELHRAHAAVQAWLAKTELELGCPSFADSSHWAEFDDKRRKYGVCPRCRRNDGVLWLQATDEFWSMCHRHRARWLVPPERVEVIFVADCSESWKDPRRPVKEYAPINPVRFADEPEVDMPISEYVDILERHAEQVKERLRLRRSQPSDQTAAADLSNSGRPSAAAHAHDAEAQVRVLDPWPPRGGATVWQRVHRAALLMYLVFVIVPVEVVKGFVSGEPAEFADQT